jgi:hypothetical protein
MGVGIAEAVIIVSHIQFDDSGTVDIQQPKIPAKLP